MKPPVSSERENKNDLLEAGVGGLGGGYVGFRLFARVVALHSVSSVNERKSGMTVLPLICLSLNAPSLSSTRP